MREGVVLGISQHKLNRVLSDVKVTNCFLIDNDLSFFFIVFDEILGSWSNFNFQFNVRTYQGLIVDRESLWNIETPIFTLCVIPLPRNDALKLRRLINSVITRSRGNLNREISTARLTCLRNHSTYSATTHLNIIITSIRVWATLKAQSYWATVTRIGDEGR